MWHKTLILNWNFLNNYYHMDINSCSCISVWLKLPKMYWPLFPRNVLPVFPPNLDFFRTMMIYFLFCIVECKILSTFESPFKRSFTWIISELHLYWSSHSLHYIFQSDGARREAAWCNIATYTNSINIQSKPSSPKYIVRKSKIMKIWWESIENFKDFSCTGWITWITLLT